MTVIIGGTGTANGISYFSSPTTFGGTLATASRGISSASVPSGSILQVQQAIKLNAFSSTSGYPTFVDVTGLSVDITPSSVNSKIYVMISLNASGDMWSAGDIFFNLVRNTTNICVSTAGASFNSSFRFVEYASTSGDTRYTTAQMGYNFLDSPSTTSSTTYKVQGCFMTGGYTWCVNRRMVNDGVGSTSSITVMEIAQ
jgi:hypothetical protein